MLLALYEPVKLAEDLAFVDLISRGRVSYVIGIGYPYEECPMFGVRGPGGVIWWRSASNCCSASGRARPSTSRGRTVRITPEAVHPRRANAGVWRGHRGGRPPAARLGLMFLAESHDSLPRGLLPCRGGDCCAGARFALRGIPNTVFVADDPERAWAEIGEYLLLDVWSYSGWNAHREGTASISGAYGRRAGRRERCLPDRHAESRPA